MSIPAQPSADVAIRDIGDADASAAATLLADCLSNEGLVRKSPEFWNWKHRNSPFGASIGRLALDSDGRIVCLRPMMKWLLGYGDRSVAGLRPVDTATAVAWRGRGLFARLTRDSLASTEGMSDALVFNTPNRNSLPGYLKMGWRQVADVGIWARPFSAGSLLGRLLATGRKSRETRQARSGYFNCLPADACSRLLDFCARAEQVRPTRGFRTMRNHAYLRWRYVDHPNGNYEYFCSGDAPEGSGGIVVFRRHAVRGVKVVSISDIFGSDPVSAATAFRDFLGGTRSVAFLLAASPQSADEMVARSCGFMKVKSIPVVARMQGDIPGDLDLGAWDLSFSDLETF